jgi:FKBP12-rapamycin complex-associated protein
VLKAVKSYLQETPCATWLSAIPQLIARLGARDLSLRGSLIEFLLRLSSTFGDALIWPLLTASQTPRSVHQSSALTIMHQVGALPRYSKMVKQAQVVGKDLILSAITPTERWKNAIEKVRATNQIPIPPCQLLTRYL